MAEYIVQPGDTLSSIAKRHDLAGWQALYFSSENDAFRRSYPDPDAIRPGARLTIPEDAREQRRVLEARLRRLQSVKLECQRLFQEQAEELDSTLREIKGVGATVDATATVLTLVTSLAGLTIKANRVMKLEGDALAVESSKFAREALKGRASNARDAAAVAVAQADRESTNTVWLVTKSVAQGWCDMLSPSFWASAAVNLAKGHSWSEAVTRRPEDVVRDAKNKLLATRMRVMAQLDQTIRETQAELAAALRRTQ